MPNPTTSTPPLGSDPPESSGVTLYMIDYWLWDVVDCMRHEEDKIPGMNTTYTVKHIQVGPTLFMKVRFITGRPRKAEKSDSAQMFLVLE